MTEIYANIKNFYDVEIPDWLDGLDAGTAGRLTIQQRNSTSFAIFDVTGSVTGSGTWRTINVKPVQASGTGTFANNAELILSFVRNGGTPQRYLFQTSTDPSTGDGLLRFDNTTFTSITKIYVNHKSWNGFIVQDWLESIDDRADVRVTVCHITNRLIRRIFKVNSVTASGGTRIINVTPLYSAGTLSDSDPVVLVCSTPTPIRDRAGSLVTQESETGWPSGHMLIENCTFLEADDGVRLDETTPTNNCADNSFVQSNFINCSVGIKCNWIQVVNNTVINCDFSGCTVAIDHAYGGDLRVFGSSMNGYGGDVFLRVQRGGVNASSFLLNGIRLEMSAGKPSLLETIGTNEFDTINVLIDSFGWTGGYPEDWDDMTDYYIGNEVFYLGTVYRSLTGTQGNPNTGNPPLSSSVDSIGDWEWRGDWVRPVRLSQNTNCTIRGSIVKGPFANVVGSTAYATLRLDNCRLSYNETDVVTVGTNGVWKTIDCTGGQGAPLLDAGNWSVNEKPPTGTIAAFGGTTAPAGYLLCDGSAVSRTTCAALFTAIGTTYGVGDGSTTFNVPNLQQKFPLGKATAGTGSTLGGTGGNIDHTHTIDDYDADVTASVSGKTANTTGTHTHTMQGANPPFLVVNYIIKT